MSSRTVPVDTGETVTGAPVPQTDESNTTSVHVTDKESEKNNVGKQEKKIYYLWLVPIGIVMLGATVFCVLKKGKR